MHTEFDPTTEQHFPLLLIKAVEPGCTTEIQLELIDGTVERFTTTEDADRDEELFEQQIIDCFRKAWGYYLANKD